MSAPASAASSSSSSSSAPLGPEASAGPPRQWEVEFNADLERLSPYVEATFKRSAAIVPLVDGHSMPTGICLPTTEVGAGALVEELVRVASQYAGQQAFKTAVYPCEIWEANKAYPPPAGELTEPTVPGPAPIGARMVRLDRGKYGVELTLPAVPEGAKLYNRLVANPQVKYVKAGAPLQDAPFEGSKPLTQVFVPFVAPTRNPPDPSYPGTRDWTQLRKLIDCALHAKYALGWLVKHSFLAATGAARAARVQLLQRLKRSAAALDFITADGTLPFANCSVNSDDEGFWLDIGDHVLATVEGKQNSLTTVENWAEWVTARLRRGELRVQIVPTLQLNRWQKGQLGLKIALRGTIVLPDDPDSFITDDTIPPTHFGGRQIVSAGRGPALYAPNDLAPLVNAAFSGPKRASAVRKSKPPAAPRSAVAATSPAGSAAGGAGGGSGDVVPATPPATIKSPRAPPALSSRALSKGAANHQRRLKRDIIPRLEARARASAAARRAILDDEAEEDDEEDDEDDEDADENGNLKGFVVDSDTEEAEEDEEEEVEEDPYDHDGSSAFRQEQLRKKKAMESALQTQVNLFKAVDANTQKQILAALDEGARKKLLRAVRGE